MDALTIQAMKNRNQNSSPIRVFDKVNRIYGHMPLWGRERQGHEDFTEHYMFGDNTTGQVYKPSKGNDEETKLKQAQKIHQAAMEEMEREKMELEKQLEERKKLLFGSPATAAPPQIAAAPPEVLKKDDDDDDEYTCVACFDAKRSVICSPCLHVALCLGCSKNLDQCPICMAPAEMKRIFLA